jgi:5'-nucleotidase
MRILITNDDGINSTGLHILVKEMEKDNEVMVVAPNSQRSACGHSITINDSLFVKEVKIEDIKSKAFSVSGTPADCVKIALEKLINGSIDMIISGINYGLNIGTDVIYSGTVSAAIEGVIYKIPSMAVSMDINNDDDALAQAASYARSILKTANENYIKNDMVINVNIPERIDKGISGVKVCQLGNKIYSDCYIETISDNDEVGFKLQGEACDDSEEDTDVYYIKNRYITITPLHYDLTNFKVLKDVEKWFVSTDLR